MRTFPHLVRDDLDRFARTDMLTRRRLLENWCFESHKGRRNVTAREGPLKKYTFAALGAALSCLVLQALAQPAGRIEQDTRLPP